MNILTIIVGIIFILFGVFTLIENRRNKDGFSIKPFTYKWLANHTSKIWNTYVPVLSGVIFIMAGIKEIPIIQNVFKALSRIIIGSFNNI